MIFSFVSRFNSRAIVLVLIASLLLSAFPASFFSFNIARAASATLFVDSFEVEPAFTSPVWTSDPKWGTNANFAHTGTRKAKVEGNTNGAAELQTSVINATGYESLTLSFWYKQQGFEGPADSKDKDKDKKKKDDEDDEDVVDIQDQVKVEWFDGTTWHEVETYLGETGDADDVDIWTLQTFSLGTGADNNPNVKVRFTAFLDAGNDKFFLDDVQLVGEDIPVVVVPKTEVEIDIYGDTAAGENLPGWMFNRDGSTATPFAFNTTQSKIGDGSIEVFPIGVNPADKFIGEFFYLDEISELTSFSYDYQIGAGGNSGDANDFYLNVYANFGTSSVTKFYDCRYNVVPTNGSAGWHTVTFDPTQSYPVTTRTGGSASPYTCPSVPADMNNLSASSTIRAFAINMGDTSASDTGLDGYFDKAVVETSDTITTYDFEPMPKAEVTLCKLDGSTPLANWRLILKGEKVEDVVVPATAPAGESTVASLDAGTSYVAIANGTWNNNRAPLNKVDAEYSTEDNWVTQMDGFTGYSTDILELQINSTFDPASDWGSYNSMHKYAQSFVPVSSGVANFRIFDGNGTTPEAGWYGDNTGSLNVSVYEGYAGDTGENGCITFDDVPYGSYEVEEIMQDGWMNVSGLGAVVVDQKNETFTVVNDQLPEVLPTSTVTMCKYDTQENALPGWQLALIGSEVNSLAFAPTAAVQKMTAVPAGDYVLKATGTYNYGNGGRFADARFSERKVGESNYSGPYLPWVVASPVHGGLAVQTNGDLGVLWGNVYNPAHIYYGSFTQAILGDIDFTMYDDAYTDNVGSIALTLNEGFTGITGENGCLTFEEVPYGTYSVEELMQPLWENQSGLGSYTVDGATERIDVVNIDTTYVPPCELEIVSDSTTVVESTMNATTTYKHPNWSASIPGATWIWNSYYATNTNIDVTRTFTDTFTIATPTAAMIDIAADNGYKLYLNGNLVADRSLPVYENNFQSHTQKNFNLFTTGFLLNGTNTITVEVTNKGVSGSNGIDNPAGVLYKLTLTGEGGCARTTIPEVVVVDPGPDTLAITNPATDYDLVARGLFDFTAEYVDNDETTDQILWAVRAGTCSPGTGTVAGNVDGFSDSSTFASTTFTATLNTSAWAAGDYCFVVNPQEQSGEPDLRANRWFTIEEEVPDIERIGGYKWDDADADGIWDEGEDAIMGWNIYLSAGESFISTTTDNTGFYYFDVEPGVWTLTEEDDVDGWTQTGQIVNGSVVASTSESFGACTFTVPNEVGYSCYFGNHEEEVDDETPTETITPSTSGGNSSSGTRTRVQAPIARVLGAATAACPLYLNDYMKIGQENNAFEVVKLQLFLSWRGFATAITGIFNSETDASVKSYQAANTAEVLQPWVDAGITSAPTPTGYVFKTTKWKINDTVCPGIAPFPVL